MRRTACTELAEARSAFVDGALSDVDRERLLAHLVGCGACRLDVEELRTVRDLLHQVGRSPAAAGAPADLSSRLVSIAGQEAFEPVWSRPFRRTGPGGLPSARRAMRVRAAAAAIAVTSLLSACGVVGYAAAPPLESTALGDPSQRVRSEFAATLTQFPLASRSLNAVMVTPTAQLLTERTPNPPRDTTQATLPVTADAAMSMLRRSVVEADRVSYSGTQRVAAYTGGQTIAALVRVSFEAGQGSTVRVYNEGGHEVVNGFVPASQPSAAPSDGLLSMLAQHYVVSGWVGSTVVGRAVTVVQAATTAPDRVAARWWVDNATGLLLWQETYDDAGRVAWSAGFTSVRISQQPEFTKHLAPRLASSSTTAKLTLSALGDLAGRGWYCRGEVAGLSLVRLGSDQAHDPGVLHMVYSDGVATVSVFEQRGVLSQPPSAGRWDPSLRAYLTPGTPTLATWQSGDRVFTVVTDGSPQLVDDAVSSLPHAEPNARTTMGRVHAGWVRILEKAVR